MASSRGEAGDVRSPFQGIEVWKNWGYSRGLSVAGAQESGGSHQGGYVMRALYLQAKGLGIIWGQRGSLEGISSGLSTWR